MLVVANDGRTDVSCWGGLLSLGGGLRGVRGAVVDGACRDVATALALGYPVFSAARFMRTGKDRVRCVEVQRPVQISGVTVAPGDLVAADADGVVAVRAAHLETVVELAERIERRIIDAVWSGATLTQARAEHGYHRLQSRTR